MLENFVEMREQMMAALAAFVDLPLNLQRSGRVVAVERT
jgi:hypothetical protein